ncbi:hypothetical protein I317_00653 [Kwoniella heveanensis CBS 569]|uniref:NmrA-like domain-containing protein n=1 Tax=Kwoniella heveanensis BCC8398 TaxID=1296120 RepID=A0A1B9GZZ4_9TREE|nr:hypothetical protein I316_01860 [Kwoniella heveanensis BCC8398]OCF45408.1 hypothetical protein I317_00653 [Kwoniella heveanensis CBS 569]
MSSSNNANKTIVVFTATGAQGGSVVDSLLEGGYKVVGLTRNVEGKGASALKSKGVQVATADLADPSSYKDALKGAYGAFVNADFWSIFKDVNYDIPSAKKEETRQATEAIKAAHEAGVQHIVYSSLDDGTECAHWQSKADAAKWALDNGIPITNLLLTAYFENISSFGLLSAPKEENGPYVLGLPMPDNVKMYGVSVAQTGKWVKAAFDQPDKYKGKDLETCTSDLTIAEMADVLSKISGKKVVTNSLNNDAFYSDGLKQALGQELWDNWKLFVENKITRNVKESIAAAPGAWDFEAWAKQDEAVKKILGI